LAYLGRETGPLAGQTGVPANKKCHFISRPDTFSCFIKL
jgi:hypothetical protein